MVPVPVVTRHRESAAPPRRTGGHRPGPLPPRTAFILRRVGRAGLSLAVVVIATFGMVHLVPGDPVRAALGPSAAPELVAATRASLGLDRPAWQQFTDYLTGLPRGDLGVSLRSHGEVATMLYERLPATLTLTLLAFVVAAGCALPWGVATAVGARSRRHPLAGTVASWITGALVAVPELLLALGSVALFGVTLAVLPVAGWGAADQAVLPVLTLAAGPFAYFARVVHVEMLAVLDAPYLTTARSKRLPARLLYFRHAVPNMLTGALTVGGTVFTGMIAATVIIETVFAIPGLGSVIVESVAGKDYPVVQGVVLGYAVLVLALNLFVDLMLAAFDPRAAGLEG